jgi:transposase
LYHKEKTLASGKFGDAVQYTLGQWDKLVRFLDHADLTPDNNKAENAIRPFVLGRKNWLFSGNDTGATASSQIYSLIETAKSNKIEPYQYLNFVLNNLPTVIKSENWDSLLPWNMPR